MSTPHPRWAPESVHLGALLVLTFSTGVADAIGYLGLDKVFTGNMTGNVVILGMGASGTTDLPVVGPLVALAAFLLGATLGGRMLRGQGPAVWGRRVTVLLCGVGAAFGLVAVVMGVSEVDQGTVAAFTLTAVLACAMGLQAAVARWLAVKDVTTVVVTSTITGLAADSRWGAGTPGHPWARRVAAVALIGAGACAGAGLMTASTALAVAVPTVLCVAVALTGGRLARAVPAGG